MTDQPTIGDRLTPEEAARLRELIARVDKDEA